MSILCHVSHQNAHISRKYQFYIIICFLAIRIFSSKKIEGTHLSDPFLPVVIVMTYLLKNPKSLCIAFSEYKSE